MDDRDNAAEETAVEESTEVEATAPPAEHKETGVAMYGDYPFNHRLRAEELSKAGKTEDPDGLITPALIEDAGKRLAAEAAAIEAARPKVSTSMKRVDLDKIAVNEKLDPAAYANIPDLVAAIEANRNPPPAQAAADDKVVPDGVVETDEEKQEG